jgi:HK97 family phage major capsid protein
MANVLSKGDLFDPKLVKDLFNQVKGKSTVAALCAQTPIEFNGNKYFVFSMDNEVDLLAENQKRSHGGITVEPIKVVPHEIEYGARVSADFMEASEDEQLDILQAFLEGFSKKVAKGLDIMAFHGKNPRTGEASALITSHFDKVNQTVQYSDGDLPDDAVEDAIALIGDWDVTGLALSKTFASALGKMRSNAGVKLYPGLSWGGDPGQVNGVKTSVNSTVSYGGNDLAIVGDFANCFKWGYSKQVKLEIIPYGDPDNTGVDLKGSGQVYLRATASIGFGILVDKAFSRVVEEG